MKKFIFAGVAVALVAGILVFASSVTKKITVSGTVTAADSSVGVIKLRAKIYDGAGKEQLYQKLELKNNAGFSFTVPSRGRAMFFADANSAEGRHFSAEQAVEPRGASQTVTLTLTPVKAEIEAYKGATIKLCGKICYAGDYQGRFRIKVFSGADLENLAPGAAPRITAEQMLKAVGGNANFSVIVPAELGTARICVNVLDRETDGPFCRDIYNVKASDIDNINLQM